MTKIHRLCFLVILVLPLASTTGGIASAEERDKTSVDVRTEQVIAAREVENVINRYEVLLAQGYVSRAYDLFAVNEPDVQADVGFGLYYGKKGIEALFLRIHGELVGDVDSGGTKPGAFYCIENTTGVVEVAEDLETAKGLWFGAGYSTPGDPENGYRAYYGMARRAVDFIKVDGEWKIWHYMVYGMVYAPVGTSYTDASVVEANINKTFPFTGELAPLIRSPSAPGIGQQYAWRPDKAMTGVLPPEPYKTFSETFSYAIKKDR